MKAGPPIKVQSKGEVTTRAVASALIPNAGDYVIVFRGIARWLILRCPSGCGDEVPINLDRRSGPAWRLYKDRRGLSLYPSVIRETGCHSHFIIWDDRILWFGSDDTESPWGWEEPVSEELRRSLLDIIREAGAIHYTDIADRLNEVPWQVLTACRALRREGRLGEGSGRNRGIFTFLK